MWRGGSSKCDGAGLKSIHGEAWGDLKCCRKISVKLFIVLFSRNHFMEGCFTFQRVGLFSDGGASFLSGGCAPWGGIGFDGGGF